MAAMRPAVYWTRLVVAIATLSLLVAVVFVWLDQRVGVVAALIGGIALAPIVGWVVSRTARKG